MASSSGSCSCINFHRLTPIYSDGYGDYNLNSLSSHDIDSLSKDLLFPKEESLPSSSTSNSSVAEDGSSIPRSMDRNSSASLILSSLINQQMRAQKLLAQPMQQNPPKRPKEKRSFRSIMLPNHKNFNFQENVVKIKLKSFRSSTENKPKLNAFFRSNSFRFERQKSNEDNGSGSVFKSMRSTPFSRSSEIRMTDEYHTPKDLVNKQPLSIGLEVFKKDDGAVESCGSESFQRLGRNSSGDPDKKQLFLEVIYNEPRDSKLYTQPGIDPDDSLKYKLYVGNESFYCKPLSCQTNYPNYEQIQNPGSTLNPSIHLMKTSLMSSSTECNNNVPHDKYTYSDHEISYHGELSELKAENVSQYNEEPYYNRMVKRPLSKPSRNKSLSKENWNSLYSDVDCNIKPIYNSSFRQCIKPENKIRDSVDHCSIPNNFSLNPSNIRQKGIDPECVKVPWHEYESSNSNVVDITHWIMNTLGSAIKLRFLDLAGLETYISQIILLIKLITTTSGVKNKTHGSSVTSSLLAIPSAVSTVEPNRYFIDGQTKLYDKNGIRLKEKRFSDIVGVIKGKKHLKNYCSNGYPGFIQSHEPLNECYYKQILTEKEDVMLRETQCDYYYQSDKQKKHRNTIPVVTVDPFLPLNIQRWFHGSITRLEAEKRLALKEVGTFLVRNSESSMTDFSLSIRSLLGFMHMKINRFEGCFILGQFSKPFETVPKMIQFYQLNSLPIRGAERIHLVTPLEEELL